MRYLVTLMCGALLPLSFAPFSLWPLGLVSMAGWFYILEKHSTRGLLAGWLFGVGKYGVGASWIYVSIHEHGNAPVPLAVFLVALFVSGMALFPMLNAWLYRRLRRSSMLANAWLFSIWPGEAPRAERDRPRAGDTPVGPGQALRRLLGGRFGPAAGRFRLRRGPDHAAVPPDLPAGLQRRSHRAR